MLNEVKHPYFWPENGFFVVRPLELDGLLRMTRSFYWDNI
jgi:hypothetical protein